MEFAESQKLIEFNSQGLIPGPSETEEAFLQRAEYCLNIKENLANHVKGEFPLTPDELSSQEELEPSFEKTRSLYGIAPSWVPAFYSNHKLLPWHGGCAWIFQLDEESPTAALLQLRKKYAKIKQSTGLYSKDEVVVHEMAHIGRMAFEEPKFEEIFAYRSSPSRLRRWLGPIAQSSAETGLFVLVLFLVVILDFFFVAFGYDAVYFKAMWLKSIPLLMIAYGILRLYRKHRQLEQCLSNLNDFFKNEETANAVAYRLTDEEIISFSTCSPEEITNYASENAKTSLRWKVIDAAYFKCKNAHN